ncbi:MAG: hypothetical protein AVDCRST_MAG76-3788 [uncultured Acidimicrobiales bacterium]|uniref:Uncharacterized protein n=1 Tax=uncultured Acidimicrobiales bacterium TaxID=310071 RepID=A0A6J4JH81_9ACTN|nr:MAG: hypothetical protein AVDCRST_MAG76-3788 [uncultured Acidimicrobiales bacterium]
MGIMKRCGWHTSGHVWGAFGVLAQGLEYDPQILGLLRARLVR